MTHWQAERNRGRKGNTLIEFALCFVFLTPLLLSSFQVGMTLMKSLQVSQVCRTAGVLFLKYIDLSIPANQDLVVRTAKGLGMTRTGGQGVVILSQIMYIDDAQCQAGGLTTSQCPNYHRTVFLKRILIGNPNLVIPATGGTVRSKYGTPNSGIVGTDGSLTAVNYLKDISAIASSMPSDLVLAGGEMAFISESVFLTPDLNLPGFRSGQPIRARPYIS
ncbi:MAG: hypothetical protein ABI693_11360 [Bryobacteraceae bacterium]